MSIESQFGAVTLDAEEAAALASLARELIGYRPGSLDPEFAKILSGDLPRSLRAALSSLLEERVLGVVVRGVDIDAARLGPTPLGWSDGTAADRSALGSAQLMLAAGWLGDVFGWASQQNGALVHDICPQPGREYDQIGAGSEAELEWHTEESFHPYKCDYLGLLTLRNPGQAATTIGHVPPDTLPDWVRRELARPVFCFLPDDAHVAEAAASESVAGMISDPVPVPVLYGGPDGPYLQVDPAYMYVLADDEPARRALAHLTDRIDASLVDLPAGPGSIVFLDNYRVVHGRRPFVPRYDGTDRWLKRVNVTRNLRASRSMRTSAASRIIT